MRLDVRDVVDPETSGRNTEQTRLMVCAHMKNAGHRGVVVTLKRLQRYCSRFHLEGCRDRIRQPLSTLHGLEGG